MSGTEEAGLAPAVDVEVDRWRDGHLEHGHDVVAEETPVALEYNGISHVVMMATPGDLEDFALGFSLTEGIVRRRGEIYDIEPIHEADGVRVAITIAAERFAGLKEQRRNLTGRTGCGLCGAETLTQAIRTPAPVGDKVRIAHAALQAGMRQMQARQGLQQRTGATHAAAWLPLGGALRLVREDVGRHNALDKMIGALVREDVAPETGVALVTSRASYEMVQKAAACGIEVLAAVSAPTALAIRLAGRIGVTLVGFTRETGHVVYSGMHRLT